MRREMDNHILRAREDVQREVQVGVFVSDNMYFECFYICESIQNSCNL